MRILNSSLTDHPYDIQILPHSILLFVLNRKKYSLNSREKSIANFFMIEKIT